MQVCGISERFSCTRLTDNEEFNSHKEFGVVDGDMNVLEMVNLLASRAVTTSVKLGTVQIKGLQALVWWIHYRHTHNHPLIAAKFGQLDKRAEIISKQIDKNRADTDAKVSGIGKFKLE